MFVYIKKHQSPGAPNAKQDELARALAQFEVSEILDTLLAEGTHCAHDEIVACALSDRYIFEVVESLASMLQRRRLCIRQFCFYNRLLPFSFAIVSLLRFYLANRYHVADGGRYEGTGPQAESAKEAAQTHRFTANAGNFLFHV